MQSKVGLHKLIKIVSQGTDQTIKNGNFVIYNRWVQQVD